MKSKLLRATALGLAVSFAVPAAAVMAKSSTADLVADVQIPYEKFTLQNGLRVIVHEDRKAPIVAVSVWYHVGSKDEKVGKTGFAHLFEHLMFNGSENYNDEYFAPFEQVGATAMNGTTWLDRTNYFQNVPTPALDMALWMESDRMGHMLGAVTQEKLDEQRGVVQNEKRQGDNQPYGKSRYSVQEGLFPQGHPYRWSTIGSMDDLNAASLDDVHSWFKEYYGTANAVVVLAGDINAADAKPLMEKYFGDIPSGPPLKRLKEWIPDRVANTKEIMYDRVPQTRIMRVWAVPSRTSEDLLNLDLASDVLGSGKTSRLYKELVYKRQIATSASAYIMPFEIASIFGVSVTLKAGQSEDEVNAVIDDIMAEFLAKGPSKKELEKVKTSTISGIVRGLEQIGGFSGKATALARGELYANDPGFYKTSLDWRANATVKGITSTANAWLSDGSHQITIRPFGQYKTSDVGADRSKLPDVGEMPSLTFPEIKTGKMDNGVEVAVATRSTIPTVQMTMVFDAGHASDFGGKLGTSGFTMGMLDEGTKKRTALEISEEQERLGAHISAGSGLDSSSFSLNAMKANLDESMALYADILQNPSFAEKELERVRALSLAGINQEKSQPVAQALRNLPPLLYGKDHPYGIPFTGSGTEESIKSITQDDLIRFRHNWLTPSHAKIYVVGDITLDEAIASLNKHFTKWGEPRGFKEKKPIPTVALPAKARVVIMDKPGAEQSLILAGHLVPGGMSDDNYVMAAMNEILGGSFTARVNMNLREDKHWAYGAYTFMRGARGQQPWMAYAPVQTDKTMESIAELVKEFDAYLGNKPATEAELDKVVKNTVRSLPGQFETAGSVLGSMVGAANYGRPLDYATTIKERYEGLTLETIHAKAQSTLKPKQLTWLVIGDRSKIEEGIRSLNLGDLEVWDKDGNKISE